MASIIDNNFARATSPIIYCLVKMLNNLASCQVEFYRNLEAQRVQGFSESLCVAVGVLQLAHQLVVRVADHNGKALGLWLL